MNARVIHWHKPRAPTQKELEQLLNAEGKKPYLYVMERNENIGVHTHTHNETRIILEGSAEFSIEGRMHQLKPGDRIDITKGTPHTAKNTHNGQTVMICGQ